ncbi:anhydro-N-acetylmuramic acid kinase [Undibacter mobilis]|uniref:Anhydro-N-acetylmuramic acid kinase n=1 Tax=Undibacter mobilis TaxID=2292256 RepID=A0A371BED9_9BRAD|nr:anhydro-N-acetylmuramic acid kinase [Undibacter mobilis]RDV05877.1 anhydro-N-acetylmuramic acid kinase [Undibacter mobilis]
MSGTSLDGVDVAAIETDGERIMAFGPTSYRAYADNERALLRQALMDARALTSRTARPGVLAEAEAFITRAHAEAVEAFLDAEGIARKAVTIVGFHGQTVLHRPGDGLTVQIGDGAALAKRLGLTVAYDFRAADVAAGGQGAPLVPIFHRALARSIERPHPIAVLNIGGVANVTWVDGGDPVACDTGPGNALIDDFMRATTGAPLDRDGDQAARGRVDEDFIARVLKHPFFDQPCPKSLDRNDFALANVGLPELSVADGAATLSALTAASVARVVARLPQAPKAWIVAGGGARNPTLMKMLSQRLAPATVETADAVGWSSQSIEAQAFAYLAMRTLGGLPITFPQTTGAPQAMSGGVIATP